MKKGWEEKKTGERGGGRGGGEKEEIKINLYTNFIKNFFPQLLLHKKFIAVIKSLSSMFKKKKKERIASL